MISPGSLVTGAAETGGDERVDNTGLDIRDTPRLGEPPPPRVRALREDQNILLLDLQYTSHSYLEHVVHEMNVDNFITF